MGRDDPFSIYLGLLLHSNEEGDGLIFGCSSGCYSNLFWLRRFASFRHQKF
jgi:hypothetical protein